MLNISTDISIIYYLRILFGFHHAVGRYDNYTQIRIRIHLSIVQTTFYNYNVI